MVWLLLAALAANGDTPTPAVKAAHSYLVAQAGMIRDPALSAHTLDMLGNPKSCVAHRAGLTEAKKDAILGVLAGAGFVTGDVKAGVFPAVYGEATACPAAAQAFTSAPGGETGGHHSYPGGLAIHTANNERAAMGWVETYRASYGELNIDRDVMIAAPIWHDWAKTLVFQWNADGTEFVEAKIAGTGAHHVLGLAETMARGMRPDFVIAQASAHAAPTLGSEPFGNEDQVVAWLRAAATIARMDPVAGKYLVKRADGKYGLPVLRGFGESPLLIEYVLHHLSDADFPMSIPAVKTVDKVLREIAPRFGFDAGDTATFNNKFRNPVLSNLTAERLFGVYSYAGTEGVVSQVRKLRQTGGF